jgi:hypothetical protein
MKRETWRVVLATVASLAVVAGLVAVGVGDAPPVRAENVACDTAEGVRCDATLVNENDDTGYDLAVRVIGYDADGDIVTTFTADATGDGADAPNIPPGGMENITIGTSPAEGAVEGDVRVVAVEPVTD